MKFLITALCGLALAVTGFSQSTFSVTGAAIPSSLARQNYGRLPKDVIAYDLNICNDSRIKQSIGSGEIYQALSKANGALNPIGRQMMLAAILRNRSHSAAAIATLVLNSATAALSILSSSSHGFASGALTGTAVASLTAQQILTGLTPVLAADQLEQFETQVLEPALVLDAGSCVERTVFAATPNPKAAAQSLNFQVR